MCSAPEPAHYDACETSYDKYNRGVDKHISRLQPESAGEELSVGEERLRRAQQPGDGKARCEASGSGPGDTRLRHSVDYLVVLGAQAKRLHHRGKGQPVSLKVTAPFWTCICFSLSLSFFGDINKNTYLLVGLYLLISISLCSRSFSSGQFFSGTMDMSLSKLWETVRDSEA